MLKHRQYILFLIIIIHNSCEGKHINWSLLGEQLEIRATISKNEMGHDKWNNSDTLGLFLLKAETSSILSNNIKYNNNSSNTNTFYSPSETEAIYLPIDNSSVSLIGYYPFDNNLKGLQYDIQLNDTPLEINKPFLYSNNCKEIDISNPSISMIFEHQLSKIIFKIDSSISTDIDNIEIIISNIPRSATFNLLKGYFNPYDDIGNITLTNYNSQNHIETLLFPGKISPYSYINCNINDSTLFIIKTSEILNKSELIKGKKYIFTIKLFDEQSLIISEINDWESVYSNETITL